MLIIGWSFLEGVGAALILPAIVALVASNFGRAGAAPRVRARRVGGRDRRRGRPADRRAVHDLCLVAVGVRRRGPDRAGDPRADRRMAGTRPGASPARPGRDGALSARARADRVRDPQVGHLGIRTAQAGGAEVVGPVAGDLARARRRGRAAGVRVVGEPAARARQPSRWSTRRCCGTRPCAAGSPRSSSSTCSRPGLFFTIPLFLSVALGLSAIATGVRLLPLSVTLLIAAVGVPKLFPRVSPRRVVRLGFLALLAGIVVMVAALDSGAGPEIVTWPMLLAGLGVGRPGLAARQRHGVVGARRTDR